MVPPASPDALLAAVAGGVRVVDLAQPWYGGMPSSPNAPGYRHALLTRHGDTVREDKGSFAGDLLVLGGHVGTHVDALAHVSHDGALHGGHDALEAQRGGRFSVHGVDTLAPIVGRGVLLDVAAALGLDALAPAHPVTVDDLERALGHAGVALGAGDVALVRSGWAQRFGDAVGFLGHATGVPGPTEAAAQWLAARGVRATGSDTLAYEHIPAGVGHATMPVHRVLLVEHGIPIIEMLDLEGLAAEGVHEFLFVLAPLKLVGATGSPARPLAIVAA